MTLHFLSPHFTLPQKAFSPVFAFRFCCPVRLCANATPSRKPFWTAPWYPSLLEGRLLPCSPSPVLILSLLGSFLQQASSDFLCVQSIVDEYFYTIQLKRKKQFKNTSPHFFFN